MCDHQRRWRHGSRKRCHGIGRLWKIRERKAFHSRVSDRKLKWIDETLHHGSSSCSSFFFSARERNREGACKSLSI